MQTGEGLWPNLWQGGPALEALYALAAWFLRRKNHPLQAPAAEAWARRLLASQNPGGGFALWQGGPSDPRSSVHAYLALRLAGLGADDAGVRALASYIAAQGGIGHASAIAWIRLLWPGAAVSGSAAALAPEHYFFADYRNWPARRRQELVCEAALSVADYLRGTARDSSASPPPGLESEFPEPDQPPAGSASSGLTSALIRQWARMAPRALRDPIVFRTYEAAVEEAMRWPTLPVALHAALAVREAGGRGMAAMDRLDRIISLLGPANTMDPPRPCDSSIRTAALALLALAPAAPQAVLGRTAAALLERFRSDPSPADHGAPRAGWSLGDLHAAPDAETTAFALLALRRASAADHPALSQAAAALVEAQNSDGGWSAYPGEPSAADVTAAVMEALAACGHPPGSEPLRKAAAFLEQQQHAEAWWRGARGICRLYGTAMALRGLRAAGVDDREAPVLRAGEWIRSIQNADGGWGEDPGSLDEPGFREAPSTPAHTAWALLGLLAGGDETSESVRRGFAWLAAHQRRDGAWDAAAPTMPGIAYAPYLMDPLGAVIWPLLAIRERLNPVASS
jgi:squalene-hopene/tetraprenyl-beta-curcumene cyclase